MADEKRPRGRPRQTEQKMSVSTWLPAKAHDRLIELAKKEDKSISALVKQLLEFRLG